MPSPFLYVLVWFHIIVVHKPRILLRKTSTSSSLSPKLPSPATRAPIGSSLLAPFWLATSTPSLPRSPRKKLELAKLKVIDCGKPVDEAAWDIVTSHIPKLLTKPQASSLKPQAMGHEHSNFWDTYSD
ncbi:uncharacterized protein LOC114383638 [Glycine soja]|uniref:uncharacterized protein LOC114383638 n=1 Tax=Glycine soja TaxID=3848 RepID=UPI00103F2B8D|nr:uncharacterized protein LOC114383638 [Glycine soja]